MRPPDALASFLDERHYLRKGAAHVEARPRLQAKPSVTPIAPITVDAITMARRSIAIAAADRFPSGRDAS